ncbi:MAG: T9SS type A sorting domain-containing protein, partial [Bacteroidales bacterium]|nr:T9SS type A sorting domain-containing protein [Bacteroidales bacterium]
STEDDFVTIVDDTEFYGNIPSDSTKSIGDGFQIELANDIPDNHTLYFTLDISDSGDDVWTSNFTDIAHAPILAYVEYSIDDTGGNNNGKIDPGESADLIISIANNGTSGAYNVLGDLSSPSPYIEIPESQVSYGDIAADTNAQRVYSIIADATTPEGHLAAFELAITADMDISANGEFEVVVGQIPVLVVDFDGNHNSFPEMDACFNNLGVARDMVNSLEDVDPNLYQSVFVCLGIYPDNYALTEAEGQKLANYLENGGNIYMEGGDTWYYDDQTAVHDMFNIEALDDGDSDLGSLNGMQGSIVEGMDYTYEGENNWIDRIAAIEPATDIFMNLEPEYISAVSYDEGSYKTIGASFEFGGFENGDYTKDELMYEILHFFGIETVWVGLEENTVLNRQTEISVYPNPFQDHLEIRIDSDKILRCSIEIFDIVGNRVMSYEAGIKNKFVKNTSALKTGIYFIRVHSENEISTHKIIKH